MFSMNFAKLSRILFLQNASGLLVPLAKRGKINEENLLSKVTDTLVKLNFSESTNNFFPSKELDREGIAVC